MKKLKIFIAVPFSFLLIACNNSISPQTEEVETETKTLDSIDEDILNQIEEEVEEADSIEETSDNTGNQGNPDVIEVNID